MTTPNPQRRRELALAASFAVAVSAVTLLRIGQLARLPDQGHFSKYFEAADAILRDGPVQARLADFSPAYLWSVVLLRRLFAISYETLSRLQIAGVGVSALLVAAAARRAGGWLAAAAAALLVLTNKAAFVCASEIEPETLILIASAAALCFVTSRRTVGLAAAGLALGIATTARPAALVPLGLLTAWLLFGTRPAQDAVVQGRLRRPLVFAGFAAIPIVAVLLANLTLTGDLTIMDPGTVFYEGMNPSATGYAGVQPRIVNDLEQTSTEADYLHVAYRVVASQAAGHALTRRETNRDWTAKALAFVHDEPLGALRLAARKPLLAVRSYDAWDLSTQVARDRALGGATWLPFGFLLALAVAGALLCRDPLRVAAALYAAGASLTLLLFYVTSRQRNALLPALAILGGLAVAELARRVRETPRQTAGIVAIVVVAGVILTIDGPLQREDAHNWGSAALAGRAASEARAARTAGNGPAAQHFAALAATYAPASVANVPAPLLAETARAEASSDDPARLFDLAIALEKAGAWDDAERLLTAVDGYEPLRENRAVASVAYYRARAALHREDMGAAKRLLDTAAHDAPGDAAILALAATLDGRSGSGPARELARLHDPFTAQLALALAEDDAGRPAAASQRLADLRRRFPAWWRPRAVAAALARREGTPFAN